MTRTTSFIVAFLFALSLNATAVGASVVRRNIVTENFTSISAATAIEVIYTNAPKASVTIEAPDDIIDRVSVKFKKENLNLEVKGKMVKDRSSKIRVYVSSPVLTSIKAESASKVLVNEPIKVSDKIKLDASSAATITIDKLAATTVKVDASSASKIVVNQVNANDVDIDASSAASVCMESIAADNVMADASSSASVELSGKCSYVRFDASSTAAIRAGQMRALTGKVSASSLGNVKCNVKKITTVDMSSAGKVVNDTK